MNFPIIMPILILASSLSLSAQINTNKSGAMSAPHADGVCTDDSDCNIKKPSGGACRARYTPIRVNLPLGAQVRAVRYYSAAVGSNKLEGPNAPCVDIQWAKWLAHSEFSEPKNVVVEAVFKNWSHNVDRTVAIEVDWETPK